MVLVYPRPLALGEMAMRPMGTSPPSLSSQVMSKRPLFRSAAEFKIAGTFCESQVSPLRTESVLEQPMLLGALVELAGIAVGGDAEVGARLQPEIVGQAGMQPGRVLIIERGRRLRQQAVVDVRRRGAAGDARPVVVLQQDDEHGLDAGRG